MGIQTTSIPRPEWRPLPHEGCHGVQGKVLLKLPHMAIAMLSFDTNGTIHEHSAEVEIDVICLDGKGMLSINGQATAIKSGETIRWPAGLKHQLWTETTTMTTLMVEHLSNVDRD